VTLARALADLADAGSTVPEIRGAPAGWEPGIRYEPDGSQLVTLPPSPALADEDSWTAAVEALGAKVPNGYRVRLVEAKYDPAAWSRGAQGEDAVTVAVWRYRFVVEAAPARIDVAELLASTRKRSKAPRPAVEDAPAFIFAAGDTQIGKVDGDGTEGTVRRFYASLDRAVDRYKRLRKAGLAHAVALLIAGDCIEGLVSQGGSLASAGRIDLTLTEQVRVWRRLLADAVQAFAELTDELLVAVVPGNHDEAERVGKSVRRYDDSWAIEAASQVADVMAAKGYEVGWTFPGRDELHLTVEVAGTRVGLLHGHQTRGKMQTWLSAKALARDAIGTADVVVSGHFHHLKLEQMGPTTWLQTGSLDGGSKWWAHSGGLDAPPAALTFLTRNGLWHGLEIV
jgi:predicted phosphodiesterase